MSLPGSGEWLIILGVALLLFGPSRLPQLGSAIGQTIKNFRRGLGNEDKEAIASPKNANTPSNRIPEA